MKTNLILSSNTQDVYLQLNPASYDLSNRYIVLDFFHEFELFHEFYLRVCVFMCVRVCVCARARACVAVLSFGRQKILDLL